MDQKWNWDNCVVNWDFHYLYSFIRSTEIYIYDSSSGMSLQMNINHILYFTNLNLKKQYWKYNIIDNSLFANLFLMKYLYIQTIINAKMLHIMYCCCIYTRHIRTPHHNISDQILWICAFIFENVVKWE